MKKPFHIVRPVNLLIIAGTMLVLMYRYTDEQNAAYWPEAIFLIVSAVLTAAAGYVVNDIFDVETDTINKPNAVIVGKTMQKKHAWILYLILNVISVVTAYAYSMKFATINTCLMAMLYLYAVQLKGMPLIGNIIVAFCSAGVLATCALHIRFDTESASWNYLGYVTFAFLISLIREMVKDMQDVEGDKHAGLKTYPIAIGIKGSKLFVFVICGIEILLCGLYSFFAWKLDFYISSIIMGAITLALFYFINSLSRAKTADEYGRESKFLKYVMFVGVINILFS